MVGTRGYDHDQWSGGFFDADLPADWRFLHYSNQFRALLLPACKTTDFLAGRLPELVEDSDDDFRFVVELSVVDGAEYVEMTPGSDFSASLAALESRWRVCLDAGADDVSDRSSMSRLAADRNVSTVWRPATEAAPIDRGDFMIARLGAASLVEMRGALEVLTSWLCEGREAGVFFDDPAVSAEQARDCRVICELLGI